MTSPRNTELLPGASQGLNSGPAEVDFRPQVLAVDELSAGCAEVLVQLLDSPDIESSSSTSSASSLPALRNDSGEAVWRLTEKAMQYLRGLQGLPFRTVDEVLPGQVRSTEQCEKDGTSTP